MTRVFMVAAASLLFLAQTAYGAASITSANRGVGANDGTNPTTSNSTTSTGLYSSSESTSANPSGTRINSAAAGQDSGISGGALFGSGFSSLDAEPFTPAFAQSFFDVFFHLDVPHTVSGGVTLQTVIDGGSAQASFSLTGPGVSIVIQDPLLGNPLALPISGMLPAGDYELHLLAASAASNNGGFSFDQASWGFGLLLTAVPEPGMLALLSTGGAALLGFALRRRR